MFAAGDIRHGSSSASPGDLPIPGTRRLERLEENIGVVDVELTADDLREIEDTASTITVQGPGIPNTSSG